MSYGGVKSQFLGLLNRRDITPSLVETFMNFGIQRIQSEVRLPVMEKTVTIVSTGTAFVQVPTDLLELIAFYTYDSVNHEKLIRCDLPTILKQSMIPGIPKYFYREGNVFNIGPIPPAGTSLNIHYYADATPLLADVDTNWITEIAPALLVYAALSYAADYFMDDRKQLFESSYQQIAERLMIQANQDEFAGATISPSFTVD